MADVDPSLTGFKDDEEDIDLLNDDTFGSGAVGKEGVSFHFYFITEQIGLYFII